MPLMVSVPTIAGVAVIPATYSLRRFLKLWPTRILEKLCLVSVDQYDKWI